MSGSGFRFSRIWDWDTWTLGEETPSLSGGEAQRLKLAARWENPSLISLFVFDEPTIGLHPWTCRLCWGFFRRLLKTVLRWW